MSDDLPEPKRPVLTDDLVRERQWRLLQTGLFVAIGYAMVHKVIVPLFLHFTPLGGSPYAELDRWFALPLLLGMHLTDARRKGGWASLLAGMCIVYGAYEVYELTQGRLVGWLAFSRLLSSIPIAVGCMALLSSRCFHARPIFAWAGALGLAIVLIAVELTGRLHGL